MKTEHCFFADWQSTRKLLEKWKLSFIETVEAMGCEQASGEAGRIGYPVVLKGISARFSHKSEHGLVRTGLRNGSELEDACRAMAEKTGPESFLVQKQAESGFEMITGILRDALFGPVVLFGPGGIYVELLDDTRMLRPPFDRSDVIRAMEKMAGYPLMKGFRGAPPVDLEAFAALVCRVGEIAADLPEHVESVDFNPVIVHPRGLSMVDARISMYESEGGASDK